MSKIPSAFLKITVGILIILLAPSFSQAQLVSNYIPRERHSFLSTELINRLTYSLDQEDQMMNGNKEVHKINISRKAFLLGKVREGAFIKDDSLESYVNNVLLKIVTDNSLDPYPRRVLILASP